MPLGYGTLRVPRRRNSNPVQILAQRVYGIVMCTVWKTAELVARLSLLFPRCLAEIMGSNDSVLQCLNQALTGRSIFGDVGTNR